MSRLNLDPLLTFPDGSHLVVSTQFSQDGQFSCTLYNAVVAADDGAAFRMVSQHLSSATCFGAQEHAYHHARQLFPRAAESLKKPPYLIWHGPRS
ncbi:MAG TPA: hypothetical protein VFS39_18935 [Nitrospira sp.]|nr:hypothetical protein [Nitrospira sp.]